MSPPHQTPPFWSTASFGDSTDTSPMELSALGEHLDACKGTSSRWFAVQCVGEAMHGFISSRFVTTLVVATLLIGVSSLVV